MASAERFAPGRAASDGEPGDFILTHRNGPLPRLIRAGQALRFRGERAPFAHWSHAAMLVDPGTLVEAEAGGVREAALEEYRDTEYHLVRLERAVDGRDRDRIAAFARSRVGQPFGYLELAGAAVTVLAGTRVSVDRRGHLVCSALVARALEHSGIIFPLDPASMLPADLAEFFRVRP